MDTRRERGRTDEMRECQRAEHTSLLAHTLCLDHLCPTNELNKLEEHSALDSTRLGCILEHAHTPLIYGLFCALRVVPRAQTYTDAEMVLVCLPQSVKPLVSNKTEAPEGTLGV